MQPHLVDCAKNSFLMDLNLVEDIIKKDDSVKAIIPVHYAGEAVSLASLKEIADKYGVYILEDAAHALETSSGGIKIGNTNHAPHFHFMQTKT